MKKFVQTYKTARGFKLAFQSTCVMMIIPLIFCLLSPVIGLCMFIAMGLGFTGLAFCFSRDWPGVDYDEKE